MGLIKPSLSGIDHATWSTLPRMERLRPLVVSWGESGFGTPESVYVLYLLKLAAYVLVGASVISATTPGLGGVADALSWWSEPVVWQKAVLYTLLFEELGFGCGFGPLTLRFLPPIGGFLYWLRPGTIRLPPWPGRVPLTIGFRRSVVDVALYVGVVASACFALMSPPAESSAGLADASVGLVDGRRVLVLAAFLALIGLRDKTVFLAARSEVYLLLALTFLLPDVEFVFAAKLGLLLIWWGAATSKLNKHFPFVVATMMSNHPLVRSKTLKRKLYTDFPDDMRPSRLARAMAHGGTVVEFTIPAVLVLSGGGWVTAVAVVVMVLFHLQILTALPMGVPLEWNVFMIFSVLVVFWQNAAVGFTGSPGGYLAVVGFLAGLTVVVQGNRHPDQWSFLIAMRYYAGNWATSMWALSPSAIAKLDANVPAWPGLPTAQLTRLYGPDTADILLHKGYAFRALHSHGRALLTLAPLAAGPDHETSHVFLDGEFIAGCALGWNFGDGHLHDENLLAALQERCHFTEGEVCVVMLEAQPIHEQTQQFRIVDAATGERSRGLVAVDDLVCRQPWSDDVPVTYSEVRR